MNAYVYEITNDIDTDYVGQVFKMLKLRPIYNITSPERFFTYYIILKDLREFEQMEKIEQIRDLIKNGDTIHNVFYDVVRNDEIGILYIHRSHIDEYEDEDFANIFF